MKKLELSLATVLLLAMPAHGQRRGSGPLSWVSSDLNPKTVFWIQGRFVPVADSKYEGDAEVVTMFCSIREHECLEFDGTSPFAQSEEVWIQDFKPINWDNKGIVADSRSPDGCTDETLRIRFAPPSVVLVNSPVLPLSEQCKQTNKAWDKLLDKDGAGLKAQVEQDMLVPTRGLLPNQDAKVNSAHGPSKKTKGQKE